MLIQQVFKKIQLLPLKYVVLIVCGFFLITGGIFLNEFRTATQNEVKKEKVVIPTSTLTPTIIIIKPTQFLQSSPTPTPAKPLLTSLPTAGYTPIQVTLPRESPIPTFSPDNEPPKTNVYYPQNGGQITYKMDGKVCAITKAPSDNQTPFSEIQTQYAFDSDEWSSYATGRAYLCKDILPNGPHTLKVRSKDNADNVEPEQTISFTVNIPDN